MRWHEPSRPPCRRPICECPHHHLCAYVFPRPRRRQIEQLHRCEPISEEDVKKLCIKAREILIEEANVQTVDAPVTVRASCFAASYLGLITSRAGGSYGNACRYAATYTGSSGTWSSSSRSAASAPRQTTSSWVRPFPAT